MKLFASCGWRGAYYLSGGFGYELTGRYCGTGDALRDVRSGALSLREELRSVEVVGGGSVLTRELGGAFGGWRNSRPARD